MSTHRPNGLWTRLPSVGTKMITDPKSKPHYTATQETDAHTALTRGLSEYLATLAIVADGGREIYFNSTLDEWAEPETEADYPAVVVTGLDEWLYDSSKFTPNVVQREQVPEPDGRFLVSPCELVQDLLVEIYATDNQERKWLTAMTELALTDSEFIYGVRLELPHYFNVRVDYAPAGGGYVDTETKAQERLRVVKLRVKAQIPVISLRGYPPAEPRLKAGQIGTKPVPVTPIMGGVG